MELSTDIPKSEPMNAEYTIVQDHGQKTSSTVWKYFGSLKKNEELIDPNHVYCSQCFEERKTKKYQKSTSTGNLLKHLKKAHHIVLESPSYRIKKEKNKIKVMKAEMILDDDTENFLMQNANYIPLAPPLDESSEYLVEDINEILITEVSKRPPIYDSSFCQRNKSAIRRLHWIEIYEVLNHLIPLEKLPKVWKNIRDRYQKIKKDIEKGASASKPKYRYYDMLRFLDNVDNSVVSTSTESYPTKLIIMPENSEQENLNDQDHPIDAVEEDETTMHELTNVKLEHINSDETEVKRIKLNNSEDESIDQSDPFITENVSFTNLIYNLFPEKSTESQAITTTPTTMEVSSKKRNDEFDIFGNFVGQVMKNMPKSKARLLQMKILQFITEFDK